ncbi:hypothetical protein [Leifsonia poae]
MAASCGTSAASVWRWENGQRTPRGPLAIRYGRVLDLLRGMQQ